VVACLRREVREESGLECDELVLRGTIPGRASAWGAGLVASSSASTRFSGTPWPENADGPLEWVEVERVLDLPCGRETATSCRLIFAGGKQFTE